MIIKKHTKENARAVGDITARFYDQSKLTGKDRAVNRIIQKLRPLFPGIMKLYILGDLVQEQRRFNVICNNGFNALIKRLVGDITYTGHLNKALLGTGSGAASASDTELIAEAYRNDMASGTDNANAVILTAFFTETECSGTYTEFGNVIDGDENPNTGRLWSHLTGLNWAKDNNTVLVISQKYTFISV
ncbi:MAG: hypothetical protein V1867_06745 [Candidatus Falkowbacteria bacterium]